MEVGSARKNTNPLVLNKMCNDLQGGMGREAVRNEATPEKRKSTRKQFQPIKNLERGSRTQSARRKISAAGAVKLFRDPFRG